MRDGYPASAKPNELRPDAPFKGRIVRVEPIAERHREGLRDAAECEPQIHGYTNMYTLGFDRCFDLALASEDKIPFVVHVDGRPVGSTRYLNVEPFHRRTEIGWTWLERRQWGTGANIETKYLLLRHASDPRSDGSIAAARAAQGTLSTTPSRAPALAHTSESIPASGPLSHGAPTLRGAQLRV